MSVDKKVTFKVTEREWEDLRMALRAWRLMNQQKVRRLEQEKRKQRKRVLDPILNLEIKRHNETVDRIGELIHRLDDQAVAQTDITHSNVIRIR